MSSVLCTALFDNGATFQVIDSGIILHKGAYLREFWNVMDAVVVVCAAVSFTFDMMWVMRTKSSSVVVVCYSASGKSQKTSIKLKKKKVFDVIHKKK